MAARQCGAALAAALVALVRSAGAAVVSSSARQAKPEVALALESNGRERFRTVATASFVRPLEYKHTLRVCNAYPSRTSFDVFHGVHGSKLTASPLQYKHCQEIVSPQMKNGDKLQFRLGEVAAGSFEVSELPNNDAVLMLIIYRHDAASTAVAFESHVFANLINAQIAILNTFKGSSKAVLQIQDGRDAKTSRSEDLRYNNVVAVNPGIYEIVAKNDANQVKARDSLVALNRESYVVVRAGIEVEQGESWPQELIIFPRSDPKVLTGAAVSTGASLLPLLMALALLLCTLLP